MVCGTTAAVGGHGTPNWDSTKAATSGCLTYTWTHSKVGNTCYYCNGFAATKTATEAVLNLPNFVSPVTNDMKVIGWMMVHVDADGKASLLLPDIATKAVMKTVAVTACGGPASVMKSGKGLKLTWTMTTGNAIPLGAALGWVNTGAGDNSANTF